MASTALTIPVRTALAGVSIEIEVVGLRRQKIRNAVGAVLLRCAGRLFGCDVSISMPSRGELQHRRSAARTALADALRAHGVHRPSIADACAVAALRAVGTRFAE